MLNLLCRTGETAILLTVSKNNLTEPDNDIEKNSDRGLILGLPLHRIGIPIHY